MAEVLQLVVLDPVQRFAVVGDFRADEQFVRIDDLVNTQFSILKIETIIRSKDVWWTKGLI